MPRGSPVFVNFALVLGLVLSGMLVHVPLASGSTGAPSAAPEVGSGAGATALASKRAHLKRERKQDQKKQDRKQQRKQERKHDKQKDRKQGERKHDRKQDSPQDSPPDPPQALELPSGRLPAAEVVALAEGSQLSAEDRYIVVLEAGTADALGAATDIAAATDGVIPTHVYENVFAGFAAVIPDDELQTILNDPRVKAVVPDEVVYADAQTLPTGIDRIDADLNPTAKIDGSDERVDVDVAVLDSAGVSSHPDVNAWTAVNCTDSPNNADDNGHGTHVGGTIAALDNGIGVVGVAPGARLWNIRVLKAVPGGASGLGSWIICGLDFVTLHAIDRGDGLGDIEVANLSLGGVGSDSNCLSALDDLFHQAFCRAVAAGVTVVVAAGNEAENAAAHVPAAYDEVITVSALVDSDGGPGGLGAATSRGPDDSLATFSNFGPDVDIAAPGVSILSTVPTGSCALCHPSGYRLLSGTSMASPHVAGAAALYLANHPGATPAQVKTQLLNTREEIALPNDPDGINEGVLKAATDSGPPPPAPPAPQPQPPQPAPQPQAPPSVQPPPPTVDGGGGQTTPKKDKKKHKKQGKKKKH